MQKAKKLTTFFLRALIAALSTGALIGIAIFLFGTFGDLEIRLLVTTLAIGGFSLTGLCCSTIYNDDNLRQFALGGVAIAIIGFGINLIGIWELWESDWSWRIMADFIILSIAFAHISLLLRITPKTQLVSYIRKTTIACISVVAVMLIWATLMEFENSNFYFRILGVFAILDVLGTILVPVLNKISDSQNNF